MEESFARVESLTRKELQQQLKAWKVPAAGTTDALRQRFADESSKQGRLSAVASPSVKQAYTPQSSDKKKKAKAVPEKRLCRLRSSCPQQIQQRIDRAVTQRLYLVQKGDVTADLTCSFAVLGSTGNVYNVEIAHTASCTCPDHRKRSALCKHILFVLLKVMQLPSNSPLVYQAAWLTTELEEMFALLAARRVGGAVVANETVRKLYAKIESGKPLEEENNSKNRKTLDEDSDCPICFESLKDGSEPLTFCRAMCGANFHASCIQRWGSTANYHGGVKQTTTCPNCRQPWQESPSKKGVPKREGYTNLGRLQGQSPVRDTSTYHSPPSYYKRGRYY
jgi:hypothetical protein